MIIDTETHVVYRWVPVERHPDVSRAFRLSWAEHSGDLLVDEMDRANVDQSFLISYDAEDMAPSLARTGLEAADLVTGNEYTATFVARYPTRFYWFTTLKDPRRSGSAERLQRCFANGAVGIKVFPAQLSLAADGDELREVCALCCEEGRRVIFSLEETTSQTPSVSDYLGQLDRLLRDLPDLRVQLNHAGCIDPLDPDAEAVFRIANDRENLLLSTSYPGMTWEDEWEYPFPTYLRRLERLRDAVGADRMMWATDWPWPESWVKYPQLVDAIRRHATFFSDDEKRLFLGENAIRFMGGLASPVVERSDRAFPSG